MQRRRSARFALLGGVFAAGCDGDSVQDPRPDRGVTIARQSQLFSGHAAMLFDGPSCTAEQDERGDRWCAFVARSSSEARSLFVANVSRASAGTTVSCGNQDPNCLELTPSLGGDSFDPTWHGTRFWGDTLIYYDQALVPYAWRPGMRSGRVLVDTAQNLDVIFCSGSAVASAIACLGVPAEQSDTSLLRATLLMGRADGVEEPPLGAVDEVIAANARDQGVPRFGYGFPAVPGDPLVWTTRDSADGPELLKMTWPGEPGDGRVVASDVHAWDVSADGKRWHWLRAVDASGAGTLESAPFPSADEPISVLPNIVEYRSASPNGSALLTLSATGALAVTDDPREASTTTSVLDEGVQALLSPSTSKHVAYAKHFVGNTFVDLFFANRENGSVCGVDTTIGVPIASLFFAPDADAAIWARSKADGFDGFHTRLADCSTSALAPDVMALGWVDGGVLFMDAFDADESHGTMRLIAAASGELLDPGTPTLIAEQVDTYAISSTPPGALLYTINAGGDADGVYVASFRPRTQ